ncbi:hypothetical protein BO71DRAFT_424773 [Aspergillus ellipticus CBS 707.79]|uniref:Uncharacterized protein n=1 Tax=Aspergillus ellipticus CBS 707.79 TaxID=1448320 RepID=A0A319E8K0_9EURO|nr:hypothetical protein BO71DRAFT_424773 [Aspergillus ellipticus CBS 707.79]
MASLMYTLVLTALPGETGCFSSPLLSSPLPFHFSFFLFLFLQQHALIPLRESFFENPPSIFLLSSSTQKIQTRPHLTSITQFLTFQLTLLSAVLTQQNALNRRKQRNRTFPLRPRTPLTQPTQLLRLIFETQSFSIELDKIAEAWPGEEKPTTKALSEQLGKYRKPGCSVTFSAGKEGQGGRY